MSRLLALTRELPYPPDAGDRIVTGGFLRALARRGHEVHLLSYARPDDDPAADALRSVCESIARVPSAGSPLPAPVRKAVRASLGRSDVMATFDSAAFREAAARRIRETTPDVVLAQHPYMGQCFLDDRVEAALDRADAAPVTSAHVVEYAAHRRLREHAEDLRTRAALAAEVPRLRRRELAVYERSARTLVLGREDRAEFADEVSGPVVRQRVGLDVDEYDAGTAADGRTAATNDAKADGGRGGGGGGDGDDDRLLFFGSYDWFPNADAARHLCETVFPAVRDRYGAVELTLAGRGADEDVAAYGEREGVTFLGEVPDLAPLVREAAAVVAPLRVGGGTRIKVLESMAWGAPVVTTPAGCEGVEAEPGEALVVADGVAEFAEATVRLVRDREERERIGANARRTIEEHYSISAIAGELERNLGLE